MRCHFPWGHRSLHWFDVSKEFNVIRIPASAKWLLFILAVLAGLVLRYAKLGHDSFWLDEGYAAWMIDRSWGEIIHEIKSDTAPPLYYLMLNGWSRIFGRSETALRAFSATAGACTLGLVFVLTRRLSRSGWALVAAMAFCASALQVEFSREVRAYGLMLVEGALLLWTMARWRETGKRKDLALLTLVGAAALYTHNAMMFYIGTAALFAPLWPGVPFQKVWKEFVVAAIVLCLAYVPWIGIFLDQRRLLQGDFWVQPIQFYTVGDVFSSLLGGACFNKLLLFLIACGLPVSCYSVQGVTVFSFACCVTIGLINSDPLHRRRMLVLLAWTIVPMAIFTAVSVISQPILMTKSLIATAPAIPVLIGLSIAPPVRNRILLWLSRVSAGVFLTVTSITTFGYFSEHSKEDWRGATQYVQSLPDADRLIVFVANEGQLPFDYYSPDSKTPRTGTPHGFFERKPHRTMRRVLTDADLDSLRQKLAEHSYAEIVLIESHNWWSDPHHRTSAFLGSRYPKAEAKYFTYVTVTLYSP